jgi:hypothetical protein
MQLDCFGEENIPGIEQLAPAAACQAFLDAGFILITHSDKAQPPQINGNGPMATLLKAEFRKSWRQESEGRAEQVLRKLSLAPPNSASIQHQLDVKHSPRQEPEHKRGPQH